MAARIIQGDVQNIDNEVPNGVVTVNEMATCAKKEQKRQETEGCRLQSEEKGENRYLNIRIIVLVGPTFMA